MNVLREVGESPLPVSILASVHPTPQNGVEVERKWKRADYAPPGNGWCSADNKYARESKAQPIPLEIPPRNGAC